MITTPRLLLRQWTDDDLEPWAAMNADPEVMRYFPAALTREQADESVARYRDHIAANGWGLWAVEVPGEDLKLAGFVGLNPLEVAGCDWTPCVEVGWRLARCAWGKGYATEAARAALAYGFDELGLDEIVAITVPANQPSRAVMHRLGMTRDPQRDFDHPRVPDDSPLKRHVTYAITATDWRRG